MVEQRVVAHDSWVVYDVDCLGVSRSARRDLAIRRVRNGSTRVAGGRRDDALDLVEVSFRAPEAAGGECGDGQSWLVGRTDERSVLLCADRHHTDEAAAQPNVSGSKRERDN